MYHLRLRHVCGHVPHEVLHPGLHRSAVLPLAVEIQELISEQLPPLQKSSARWSLPGLQCRDLSLGLPPPSNFLNFFLFLDFLLNVEFF